MLMRERADPPWAPLDIVRVAVCLVRYFKPSNSSVQLKLLICILILSDSSWINTPALLIITCLSKCWIQFLGSKNTGSYYTHTRSYYVSPPVEWLTRIISSIIYVFKSKAWLPFLTEAKVSGFCRGWDIETIISFCCVFAILKSASETRENIK